MDFLCKTTAAGLSGRAIIGRIIDPVMMCDRESMILADISKVEFATNVCSSR